MAYSVGKFVLRRKIFFFICFPYVKSPLFIYLFIFILFFFFFFLSNGASEPGTPEDGSGKRKLKNGADGEAKKMRTDMVGSSSQLSTPGRLVTPLLL